MERTFWIQGRTGRYWQNLESLDSDQGAIIRLGSLISEDRYDELRLVQAQISQISGETSYTNIVTVRDGQVIDSPMLRAEREAKSAATAAIPAPAPPSDEPPSAEQLHREAIKPVAAPIEAPNPEPPQVTLHADADDEDAIENHPQLRFWPTPRPENLQGRLGLHGEKQWADPVPGLIAHTSLRKPEAPTPEAAPSIAPAPQTTAAKPAQPLTGDQHVSSVSSSTKGRLTSPPLEAPTTAEDAVLRGGWRIPENLAEVVEPPAAEETGATAAPATKQIPEQIPEPAIEDVPPRVERLRSRRKQRAPKKDRGLAADPAGRVERQAKDGAHPSRWFTGPASRKGQRKGIGWTNRTTGRVALMSGVFAGALAAGLALSAINPDFAGRFFTGISGQFGQLLPRVGLIDAIAQGDLRAVRARLAEGADPNLVDAEGTPVLLRAARAGNLAAVSLLLQAGADPTLPTQDGRSVLHRAAAEGRSQALQRMLDAGAPVDLAGGVYGCLTPLSVAAANGRVRAASLLAERGASFEPQNGCSAGPMEVAAGHAHVLARLEQIRADRDAILQARKGPAPSASDVGAILSAADQDTGHPMVAGTEPTTLEPPLPEGADTASILSAAVQAIPETPPADSAQADEKPDSVEVASAASDTFLPPPKPEPPKLLNPRVFQSRLKTAIDTGDKGMMVALLGEIPPGFSLNEARYAVEDRFGSGIRTPLEQAALSGEDDIVRALSDHGAEIPTELVSRIVEHADEPKMASMLSVLLESGANPNGMTDGLSPLMRASLRGDVETAYMLLAFGADPSTVSADGRLASDFARDAGRADLQERLVMAASEPQYRDLMMGLSWSDTLSSLRGRVEVCKDIGDDFTACKLRVDTWLSDAKVVIGQFDRKASDRLVAIQVDSRPIADPDKAIADFEAAKRGIQAHIPAGQAGFLTAEFPSKETLFQDLRPEVQRARYFSYWPDQDRRRPVFIHLKLTGLDDQHGFYRMVIGNPFRAS